MSLLLLFGSAPIEAAPPEVPPQVDGGGPMGGSPKHSVNVQRWLDARLEDDDVCAAITSLLL